MPKVTMRTPQELMETAIELLEKYGPAIERLADHFDRLEKAGITSGAAAVARQKREVAPGDPVEAVVDLLGELFKSKIQQGRGRRR